MSYPFGPPEPPFSFETLVSYFHMVLDALPDQRTGNNILYSMKDAALGAFAVFFTQSPSFLAFQKAMQEAKGISNAQTLFGMEEIPCDNRIRTLLDGVPPTALDPLFAYIFRGLVAGGYLTEWRALNGTLLLALDGLQYFSSTVIHCPNCSTTQPTNGTVSYRHQALTPVLVAPGYDKVIPLMPEFITPQDGHDKQDCETAAAKRWLQHYGACYQSLGITVLGDDLYCRQPLCEQLLQVGFNFILVCKPSSHPTLYDWLAGLKVESLVQRRWTGRSHEIDTYRYVNRLPLRDGNAALEVNWCELTTTRDDGTVLYHNSWVTNYHLTRENVKAIVTTGRARWKIENENNNILKNRGYHFEHNYGHGQQYLASFLATLNLLAFLFHTVLELIDAKYRLLRDVLPTRQTFFDDIRALTRYLCFASWDDLLTFMLRGLEREIPNTS